MKTLDLLKNKIDIILLNATKEFYDNKFIKEILENKNIDEILEKQKEIISEYIYKFDRNAWNKNFEEFYEKLNIPFSVIYSNLKRDIKTFI